MDANVIGFGVRRTPKTRKVVFFVRRCVDGVEKKETIGRHPQLSVREARKLARQTITRLEREPIQCPACQHGRHGKHTEPVLTETIHDTKLDRILSFVTTERSMVTVRELWEKIGPGWLAPLKPATQKAIEWKFHTILETWGETPAVEVTNGRLTRWYEELAQTAPIRAAFLSRRLILLLKKAVEQELLESVPKFSIKFAQPKKRLPVTRQVVLRLVTVLEDVLNQPNRASSHACAHALISVLNTGERAKAAASLRIREVDYESQAITKSRKNDTTLKIPISRFMVSFLKSIERDGSEYYFPNSRDAAKPISYATLRVFIAKLCDAHDIRDSGGRRPTLHSFRHTYATMLADKGLPVTHIQRLLGHTSIKSTMRYIHASTAAVRESANVLEVAHVKLRGPGPDVSGHPGTG